MQEELTPGKCWLQAIHEPLYRIASLGLISDVSLNKLNISDI